MKTKVNSRKIFILFYGKLQIKFSKKKLLARATEAVNTYLMSLWCGAGAWGWSDGAGTAMATGGGIGGAAASPLGGNGGRTERFISIVCPKLSVIKVYSMIQRGFLLPSECASAFLGVYDTYHHRKYRKFVYNVHMTPMGLKSRTIDNVYHPFCYLQKF